MTAVSMAFPKPLRYVFSAPRLHLISDTARSRFPCHGDAPGGEGGGKGTKPALFGAPCVLQTAQKHSRPDISTDREPAASDTVHTTVTHSTKQHLAPLTHSRPRHGSNLSCETNPKGYRQH